MTSSHHLPSQSPRPRPLLHLSSEKTTTTSPCHLLLPVSSSNASSEQSCKLQSPQSPHRPLFIFPDRCIAICLAEAQLRSLHAVCTSQESTGALFAAPSPRRAAASLTSCQPPPCIRSCHSLLLPLRTGVCHVRAFFAADRSLPDLQLTPALPWPSAISRRPVHHLLGSSCCSQISIVLPPSCASLPRRPNSSSYLTRLGPRVFSSCLGPSVIRRFSR